MLKEKYTDVLKLGEELKVKDGYVNEEGGKLKIDTDRFKWAARNLCEHARSCGSSDNFSVVVVDLKSCGNPIARSGRYEP